MASVDGTLPETGLHKGTNWWGAFVIGLAGTILVTGIAPYVVQGTGALGIILIGVMTIAGCFLCLCLAELATMWPDRTGGIPGYATESFRPLVGNTAARHIGGVSGWAYWLGWFPVAPINVILTASYLAVLFGFSPGRQDRAHRRGPVRDVHLHRDAAAVHRRARRGAEHRRPADPLPHLHQPHLRRRVMGEVVRRPAADRGPGPVGAERHHGLRPVAFPGGRRR